MYLGQNVTIFHCGRLGEHVLTSEEVEEEESVHGHERVAEGGSGVGVCVWVGVCWVWGM